MKLIKCRFLIAILIGILMMNFGIFTFDLQRKRSWRRHKMRTFEEVPKKLQNETSQGFLDATKSLFTMDNLANINDILWRVSSVIPSLGLVSGFLTGILQIAGNEDPNMLLLKEIDNGVKQLKTTIERNHQEVLTALNFNAYLGDLDKALKKVETMVEYYLQFSTQKNLNEKTIKHLTDYILNGQVELDWLLENLAGKFSGMNMLNVPNKFGLDKVTTLTLIANYDNGGTEKLKTIIKEITTLAVVGTLGYSVVKNYTNITAKDDFMGDLLISIDNTRTIFNYLETNKITLANNWIDQFREDIVEWSSNSDSKNYKDLPEKIMNKLFSKFAVSSFVLCADEVQGEGYTYSNVKVLFKNNVRCFVHVTKNDEYNSDRSRIIRDNLVNELKNKHNCGSGYNGKPGVCIDGPRSKSKTFIKTNLSGYTTQEINYSYENCIGGWSGSNYIEDYDCKTYDKKAVIYVQSN